MSHHRYWRPPWEEVETRTGGYYGRHGYPTATDDDDEGYYARRSSAGGLCSPEDHFSRRNYCDAADIRQQRMHHADPGQVQQREQRYHGPPEYYGGNERTRWDGYGGPSYQHFHEYGLAPSATYGRNCPPLRQARVSPQDTNSYDGERRYFARAVRPTVDDHNTSAHGGSPPPSTISTSSASPSTDDSSDDSQGAVIDGPDPFDGYARAPAESHQQPPSTKRKMIELVPGVKMLLRGAKETWEAFQRKFYVSATCIGCSSKIFCIKDADYVLCPVCRVVSPLVVQEISSSKPCSSSSRWRRIGGLGLGFTGEQDLRSQRQNKKLEQMSYK